MPKNLLDPVDFSCLVEAMTPERVQLVMSTLTYQALLNRLGSLGGTAGIIPQNALNGIPINYDPAKPLHEVTFKYRPPHTRANVTVTLDL